LRVAGGVILGILGIKMALGHSLTDTEKIRGNSKALASIIASPLMTGPAAITTIIITAHDYGMLLTGIPMSVVLLLSLAILYASSWVVKRIGETSIQVMSTMMGLITIAWAVMFIKTGLGF
jgi:multiple antibiotic resistance protein